MTNLIPLVGALQKFIADCDDSDKLHGLDAAISDLAGTAEDRAMELDEPMEVGPDKDWFVTKIRRAIEDSNSMEECEHASEMLFAMEGAVLDKMRELGPPK